METKRKRYYTRGCELRCTAHEVVLVCKTNQLARHLAHRMNRAVKRYNETKGDPLIS